MNNTKTGHDTAAHVKVYVKQLKISEYLFGNIWALFQTKITPHKEEVISKSLATLCLDSKLPNMGPNMSHDFQIAKPQQSSPLLSPMMVGTNYSVVQGVFTFSRAVDGLVVSSFGHLEHPCPQQVPIGAVGRCVTTRPLNPKQEHTHQHTAEPHLYS